MLLPTLSFFSLLLAASWLFALLEIHIEGGHGWAANLPTWRVKNRWTKLVLGDKPLTGYHLYAMLFVLVMAHAPVLLAAGGPTWKAEARAAAFFVLFWIIEDFLWFVINPAFGVRRFRREHIWWHASSWWLVMPRDYWVFTPVGLALLWLSL